MLRRYFNCAILLIAFASATLAHAALSETTYNKYNQTASIATHQMFAPASSYTGNYQFAVVLNGNADACAGGVTALVQWTDENGPQSMGINIYTPDSPTSCSYFTSGNYPGAVFMVHALANTTVNVTVTLGSQATPGPSPVYNLSVNAIGFW